MKKKQVYIRILEESDISTTTKWLNDIEISDRLGYLPIFYLHDQLEWFKRVESDKTRYIFAICNNSNDEHIGNVGLGNIDYISRHCMFNIFIYDPQNRHKGIGVEATELALEFAFNKLNMNKVYLRTSERFTGAIRLYNKLGFVREGIMRQHYYSDGKYEDKILYSLLRSEFYDQKNH
jgi:RimJ/RimL family protein N-acetyltransferase